MATIFDGSREIIFSNSYVVHRNRLTIRDVEGLTIEINFIENSERAGFPLEIAPNTSGGLLIQRKKTITATNWFNTLGVATTAPIVLVPSATHPILLSLRTQKVTDASMLVTVTIFKGV